MADPDSFSYVSTTILDKKHATDGKCETSTICFKIY